MKDNLQLTQKCIFNARLQSNLMNFNERERERERKREREREREIC